MKPEFSKPFSAEHARAGALYGCKDGQHVEILKWDCNHLRYPLIGVICEDGFHYPESWTASGTQASDGELERRPGRDLVMLPLGLIDGKPVFVGDRLEQRDRHNEAWIARDAQPQDRDFSTSRWPAPAKVHPEFAGDLDSLRRQYNAVLGEEMGRCLLRVANAALRHACDAGQVVAKDDHEAAMHRLGDRLKGITLGDRAARDLAIADAVRTAALTCHPLARGYEASEDRNELWCRIVSLDLATIISTVK